MSNSFLRIAIITFTFFLVQLLVSQSRYNTRLAAFYNGRADALLLIQSREMSNYAADPLDLMTTLSPDMLDFGKSPKSVMDQAARLAEDVNRSRRG